jgi:probable HAF family extracellular repeat protein
MLDLGTLDGDSDSSAAAINNRGEIVGSSGTEQSTASGVEFAPQHAFIYTNGQMYDLNKLIDPPISPSPFGEVVQLYGAVAINSAGWIAANGIRYVSGTGTALELFVEVYLLIPNATP